MQALRLFFLSLFTLQSTLVANAQGTPEQILESEISKAKIRYRIAKSKELEDSTQIRIFVVSFDKQLSETRGLALNEAKALEYVQLPSGNFAKTISSSDLIPTEVPGLVEAFRTVLQSGDPGPGAICHEPTHCVTFIRRDQHDPTKDRVLLSISVSVHCRNFIFPFASDLGNQAITTGDRLQTELLKLVGYPDTEQRRFEKRTDEDSTIRQPK